jgi:YD repeat-containing protein
MAGKFRITNFTLILEYAQRLSTIIDKMLYGLDGGLTEHAPLAASHCGRLLGHNAQIQCQPRNPLHPCPQTANCNRLATPREPGAISKARIERRGSCESSAVVRYSRTPEERRITWTMAARSRTHCTSFAVASHAARTMETTPAASSSWSIILLVGPRSASMRERNECTRPISH